MLLGLLVSGKYFQHIEFSILQTKILGNEGLKFCKKLSANGRRSRRLTMQQYVLQYVQVKTLAKTPTCPNCKEVV